MRRSPILPLALLLALTSLAFALAAGSMPLTLSEVWGGLVGDGESLAAQVVNELRLPRALTAFAVGGLLALAGALMQALLGNPLADPYVLGISGGAAVGALGALLLGAGGAALQGGALTGALLTMLLVFGLARGEGAWSSTRLLLTGVVVAAGWGALISFILSIAPEAGLRGMLFWLMGDLAGSATPTYGLVALGFGLLFTLPLARSLNLLVRGELQAATLGVAVRPLKYLLYFAASGLTAVAVTLGGSIGFVGLVVPHAVRLLAGSDHRLLLPTSVLLGGALLVFADTLARTLIAPQQLPVGVLTALVGVPLFLFLLQRGHR